MTRKSNPRSRVLLLELDSLSLPFIRSNIDQLPTLRTLLDTGGLIETESTGHIASASVWPTFATGSLPGHHGHYFPFQWHPEKMRFYRPYRKAWNGALLYEPFWYPLARDGFDCLVLDAVQCVPMPHSPCLEINDWSAQSSGRAQVSDPGVLKELRKRFGRNPIGPEITVSKSRKQSEHLVEKVLDSLRRKTDALIWLGTSRPWNFYLASIQDVHRAGHNLWPVDEEFASDVPPGSLLRVYQAMDQAIDRIQQAFSDGRTTMVFFTLNGMATNRAQNHFLPQLLQRLNHLYTTGEKRVDTSSRRNGIIAALRDTVPAAIQLRANRMLGEDVQDWVVNREYLGALKWEKTPSIPIPSGGEGFIRLNIKGREKHGCLSQEGGEAVSYADWLTEKLLNVRDAQSGEQLISEVIDLHKLYPGNRSSMLPDLALQWSPDRPLTRITSPDIGTIEKRLSTGRGGNHTGESFALVQASTMDSGFEDDLRSITDYARLVTSLLKQ